MVSAETTNILNRLLVLHHRSLPVFLSYAVPWQHGDNDAVRETLHQIAGDHEATAERLGETIRDGGDSPAQGEFPMRFTSLHDLSFDFLLTQVLEQQRQLIAAITDGVQHLRTSPAAQALALEALGEAKAHLQSLEELKPQLAAARR